jgi:AAA15 family ATPase/GTPase
MINHLNVKNFKAWENLNISFGKVTGIFGTNSSGKSSLLQMLLLLKQTKNTPDRNIVLDFGDADKLINLGTYHDVIHKHEIDRKLSWSLDWQASDNIKILSC